MRWPAAKAVVSGKPAMAACLTLPETAAWQGQLICLYRTQTLHPCSGAKEGASGPPKPAALKEELVGCLLLTLQLHPAAKLPRAFSPLNSSQEGKMSAVLEAAANQHAHYVLAAWLGTAKIALQVCTCCFPGHGHAAAVAMSCRQEYGEAA